MNPDEHGSWGGSPVLPLLALDHRPVNRCSARTSAVLSNSYLC